MSCTRIFVRSQLAMVMLRKNNQLTTKDMPDITDKFSRNEETKRPQNHYTGQKMA